VEIARGEKASLMMLLMLIDANNLVLISLCAEIKTRSVENDEMVFFGIVIKIWLYPFWNLCSVNHSNFLR
jgi:hypothetical protein